MEDIDSLRETIWLERDSGVHLAVENRAASPEGDGLQLVDDFVRRRGMHPLGQRWHEISREAAFRHIAVLLHEDSAYGGEIMTKKRAKELAQQVLEMVPDARYFTNADTENGLVRWGADFNRTSWTPITEATFDSGVVMLSETQIGFFWVEDED